MTAPLEKMQSKFGRRRNGKHGVGKGDAPRNNWSAQFRKNYDDIKWGDSPRKRSR